MRPRAGWLRRLSGPANALRWSIVIAAPGGPAKEQWGDTWFARDLVAALRRLGQVARVVPRSAAQAPARDEDDVVVVLRGLHRVQPRPRGACWMLWVISHPDLVDAEEAAAYDAVFAASRHWSRAAELGAEPLLQATEPRRFSPSAAAADTGVPLLFVGSTRGAIRPIVRDAIAAGGRPAVFGVGWDGLIDQGLIRGEFLPNPQLPAAYASAGVVLNDHWSDMAKEGFLSNRLFDASATGARVLSDEATGLGEVFGDVVRTYRAPADLAALIGTPDAFAERATRLELADEVSRRHSFDDRAKVLLDRALELGSRG
ncbi:MAG: hypothetical protein KGP12_01590 [Actinomycetales bacterium]|nr:hypothetical protein [Actinomycetales bacterium]